jgi:hypothetical protein
LFGPLQFTNPKNGDTIQADKTFTMTMAIKNLQTGNFVNAQKNYFAAPAQVNAQGQLDSIPLLARRKYRADILPTCRTQAS